MAGTLVTDQLTPLTLVGGLTAIAHGFRRVLNSDPPAKCLAALGAHSALETGRFQKAHCNNWGNRKKPASWEGLFTRFRCDEIFDAATAKRAQELGPCVVAPWKDGPLFRVILIPPHPWSEFVAFEDADHGMEDHVGLLACNERYRLAWSRAYNGDAFGMAEALHTAGYMTADVGPYARGMASLALDLAPICTTVLGDAPVVSDGQVAAVDALISRTMAEARWGSPEQFPMENA